MDWLLRRARQELAEVRLAIKENRPYREVQGEAADVANFMLMIADNYSEDSTND